MEYLKTLIEKNENDAFMEQVNIDNMYDFASPHGENLLHWTLAFNNVTLTNYLLSLAFMPDIGNSRNASAIYYGLIKKNVEACIALLKENPDVRNKNGYSGQFVLDCYEQYNNTDQELYDMIIMCEQTVP